mmetsp:Transcript_2930/g.8984  ORF Transcript_2930/g.8984 Transcript_2930/m.8984 type:complete len:164 (-) Transcript_2930:208-699(-)|eukprot:CAMPEP_0198725360 /NCGR_PEP_ID=MMETSP1475-20131203/2675_1 /TAXON_ID= ORGANISM="Unidentified sp., Strain CCMP1999" /NCGR_SAMPLE_ID=MMETSP1475 /ASSEMBLY_ACC=CAM_ASM_001111 /LENGTH=163 /DNA_ID=CAMNT_0044487117 /DNA_START=146 /DNA_END=637 /DNA_ORIENTATION=+
MSVTLHTTFGDLKVELYCDLTPKTTENFLALCASGSYNGSAFHRNMRGFMIQGGDPTGTGKKSKSIWGGKFEDEIVPTLKFSKRGVLAMATSGPNLNGSQFFITYAPAPHLNKTCTIFGHVIHGDETLDALESVEVDAKSVPTRRVAIEKVTIHANPFAELAT